MKMLKKYVQKKDVIKKYTKKQVVDGQNYFSSKGQVARELYKRFGILGAAGDRHLAEFVPWFLTSKESCYRWGFRLTPFTYRLKRYRELPKAAAKLLRSGKHPFLNGSGEEYINQMLAVTGNAAFRTNVNLPNKGQMEGIPMGAVVETNALFSKGGVEPVISGRLPDPVNQLVLRHVINQESLIKAVWNRDEDLAFQAFASDPLCSRLGMDDAWKLFSIMTKKTGFKF